MDSCIFCKIVRGEIPSTKLYEDDLVLSFMDINPINPGHVLVIPRTHYATLFEADPVALQACVTVARKIGKAVIRAVSAQGLNFLQNNHRAAGQLIEHLHFHLIPRYENDGFLTTWPGKPYPTGDLQTTHRKIMAAME
jgi:histidine triad (HIT) family protein